MDLGAADVPQRTALALTGGAPFEDVLVDQVVDREAMPDADTAVRTKR